MSVTVVDSATIATVAAASTQDAQLAAAIAPWASGNVTVRYMAGAAVAETCVHGPWVLNGDTPRGMTLGPLISSAVAMPGATITSVAYAVGAITIFTQPVTDLTLDSPTTLAGRRTNIADAVAGHVTITGSVALPVAPLPDTFLLTFAVDNTATAAIAATGSIINTGTGACMWGISPPGGVTVTPSSGTLAAGGTQSLAVTAAVAGTYGLTLVSAGATIAGNPQSIVVSAAAATALTIAMPPSAPAGTSVDVTVTPNGPVAGGVAATLSATAGTLGATTLTWADGEAGAKTTTLLMATAGASSVTMTNDAGLENVGSPTSFTALAAAASFTTVTLTGTNSSPPLDTANQWVVLSLHGSGTNYDLFYGRKYTADLPVSLSYETDNQFKFAIQNSTSGSTPTQMTILPNDRQENLPSGNRREMFWMGVNATPSASEPVDMVMERRLDAMMAWFDANYPQASATRRVATGGSMGAYGTFTYALKRPNKFAALYPDRPRWRSASTPNTIWCPSWSTGATNVYPFGAGPSLAAADGGYPLQEHLDHLAWIANPANDLPWIGWCVGKADGYTPFEDHIAAVAALRSRGAGFAFYWNSGNHSEGARLNFELLPTYPVYLWEIGKGYPVFSEHSLDDDPATAAEGGINIGLSFRNVVETATTWSCEVRHQGTTFRPAQACSVKVKPKSSIYGADPIPQLVNLPGGGAWVTVSF